MLATITDWKNKAVRLQNQLENFKEQGIAIAERGANVGLNVLGGASAAAAAVYMPMLPGTQMPTDLIAGGAIAAIGVFGFADRMSEQLASFGGGLLAVGAFRALEPQLRARAAA